MTTKALPSMLPTGWFQVGWSADISIGEVAPKHYFGRDLVLFRELDGRVSVLDAHCQHLGASLAHGGCVVEDGIQCPFHGWVWNGNGRNVRIPYQDRPNRGRRVRSYPVAELNDSIYIWHDADGREPMWEAPNAFDVLGTHVRERQFHPFDGDCRTHHEMVKVHPQVIAENAVDPHHFRFVHRTPISPVVLREHTDDSTWRAKVGFGKRWGDGVDRAAAPLVEQDESAVELRVVHRRHRTGAHGLGGHHASLDRGVVEAGACGPQSLRTLGVP